MSTYKKVIQTVAHTEAVIYKDDKEISRLENYDSWLEDEETVPMADEDFEEFVD